MRGFGDRATPPAGRTVRPSGDSSQIRRYGAQVGRTNFLVEGVSCTGKTTVCTELQRRGYHAINGDTELAYQGDPVTGAPTDGDTHEHHIWHVDKVEALIANRDESVTFFCGGSRNFPAFLHLFDGVFVLAIDADTLIQRLDERPDDDWGARPSERELIVRLHRTGEDTPKGVLIDATQPLACVVDEIIRQANAPRR
jgi:gluconate kinase